ncbi:amino acid adenylation domain-containing protein [Streptomyces sp. NBC_00564]|uniref:amino acid adenylation domain-containing protein n=1 Tax=Streptomyces sp. NBC_00564 TaxID=2903663 RepID=UPI00352E5957|nr:amino acid adenylation domain-containing protein [Streptomyces sp. NBC_00564]
MTLRRPSVTAGPGHPVPAAATAHEAVLRQAARTPRATALRGPGGTSLSYAELADRSREIGRRLTAAGVRPGAFVPVVAVNGADFVVAALGVLLSGAAYAAVDPAWPAARVRGVVADLGATVAIETSAIETGGGAGRLPEGLRVISLAGSAETAVDAGDLAVVAETAVGSGDLAVVAETAVDSRDLAFVGADAPACVFFTSGSTGRPKGVVVPHRAFVRTFVEGGYAEFGAGAVMPLLAAPYWDAGALEVFGPLMNGGTCVVPDEPLITPDGLRGLVSTHGVNTLWLTSSLVNLLVDEDPDAFTGVRQLLCGGERLSPAHIAALLARHPGLRITNGYGPVESMVFVATHDIRAADTGAEYGIPLGLPVRGTLVAVLDSEGQTVECGTEGELWVAGDGLALGYLGRPEEDARRFAAIDVPGYGTLRAYRTGDRVRMDDEGRLSFIGRADRQFKIRGYRVEPGEVERGVAAVPGVRQAFLIPLRDAHGTVTATVCAYATESAAPLPEHALRESAGEALASHLRPDRYLHLHPVPLGPTGKADVRAVEAWVTEQVAAARPEPVSAEASASTVLREVRAILGEPGLTPGTDLLLGGASSLHMLRIAARLGRLLGVRLSVREVYENPTVRALEALAARAPAQQAAPAPTTPASELSPGERRFWLAGRLVPDAPGHVAISRIEITGALDPERLARALAAVVAAHPALRTTFPRRAGRPRRSVSEPGAAAPPLVLAQGHLDEGELTRELVARVQDLEGGPLFAAGLLGGGGDSEDHQGRGAGRDGLHGPGAAGEVRHAEVASAAGLHRGGGRAVSHLLLLAVHHIVYDGRSEEVLVGDLAAAYEGGAVAPAPAPPSGGTPLDGAEQAYWKTELEGLPAARWPGGGRDLQMRELWTRPLLSRHVGLSAEQTDALREFAARARYPVLVPLLAAWWRALAKVTGQDDLAIGTIVDTRDAAHERTVGYLANGLPVRIAADPALDPGELLRLVGDRLLDVLAHSAPGTDELAALAPRPAGGRTPLYQNLLVLQRVARPAEGGGARFVPLAAPALGPQAELCCELWDDGTAFTGAVHAPEGLFDLPALAEITALFRAELTRFTDRAPKDPT